MVTLFCYWTSKVLLLFSRRQCSQHPRLSWPEQFALCLGKWGSKNVPCLFGMMASSLVLFIFGHAREDFQFNECIKNSVEQAKKHTWRQYGQTCKKLEKSWRRQGHFVWCGVFLQCSEIDGDCFEIFQSQLGNPRISPVEFSLDTTCWSKKQDAGLLTGNTTRIFCDNVTCFGTSKCCSSRSHLSGCFKCSSLLACKAAKVQLPSIYVLQTVFKKLCSIKQGILSGTSWHFSEISSDIIWHICSVGAWKYLTWCQSGQWNVD